MSNKVKHEWATLPKKSITEEDPFEIIDPIKHHADLVAEEIRRKIDAKLDQLLKGKPVEPKPEPEVKGRIFDFPINVDPALPSGTFFIGPPGKPKTTFATKTTFDPSTTPVATLRANSDALVLGSDARKNHALYTRDAITFLGDCKIHVRRWKITTPVSAFSILGGSGGKTSPSKGWESEQRVLEPHLFARLIGGLNLTLDSMHVNAAGNLVSSYRVYSGDQKHLADGSDVGRLDIITHDHIEIVQVKLTIGTNEYNLSSMNLHKRGLSHEDIVYLLGMRVTDD